MKNSISSQPHFLCRVVRFWSPLAGGASSRHAAACADCQRYFAACHDLESALRRDASRQRVDVAPDLEQRIVRAVNFSKPPAKTSLLRPGFLAFTGIAAAVALTVVQLTKSPHLTGASAPMADISTAPTVAAGPEATPTIAWNAALPAARDLLQQDPLNDEVNSVYHDAKSAVNFLAQNFLPSSPEAAASSG